MTTIKSLLIPSLLLLLSCGKPGEQEANRQKLLDGLADQKVKRVTPEQIHTAAMQEGQNIVEKLEDLSKENTFWETSKGQLYLDSLNTSLNHGGIALLSQNSASGEINTDERALLEAYQYSSDQGQPVRANVQSIPGEYLLFTSPVMQESVFTGMWSILLSKKTLIRNL